MDKKIRSLVRLFISSLNDPSPRSRILLVGLLSLPVALYCLPFLLTGNQLAPGDADFLMQAQEALNISVFKYGQFPWWNPWIAGGVPLFANPQFGLVSLPTLFGILFGSVVGYKVALSVYILISFWGFYLVFNRVFNTPGVTAALLSYIWAFSGFFAYRIAGHYTFFTIAFFPVMLLLLLGRKQFRYPWLWLGVIIGLLLNSSVHYMTIMTLVIFCIIAATEIFSISIRNPAVTWKLDVVVLLVKSFALGIVLALPKLYYSLDYIQQYPRNPALFGESSIGIPKALFAMFGPIRQYSDTPSVPSWSWMEASAYIGFCTALVAMLCAYLFLRHKKNHGFNKSTRLPVWFVAGIGAVFFLLGLGPILGEFSPFVMLSHFPVFSNMRVATRWIAWCSIMVIVFIALYRGRPLRGIINGLLLISSVELFIFGMLFMPKSYIIPSTQYSSNTSLRQHAHFDSKRLGIPYDENFTLATKSNRGQVIAGDPLVDTRFQPPFGIGTTRCGVEERSCSGLVLSNNAKVKQWTPNYLVLERIGAGDIVLNMNPGRNWLVNGEYPFYSMRVAEPNEEFRINDPSDTIELRIQPKYSVGWLMWKIAGK